MTDKVERRLAAILSADVAGYTRLMRADEEGTLARFRAHRTELVEPKVTEHRGRIVKLMGDGPLVEFASVVDAVRCATEIQRGMATRNTGVPEAEQIVLRIGINLGDVIVEGDDIYGDGVNVATRMQEISPPGGISVSGVVYDSVHDKLAPHFEDLGPQRIKNIAEPVRAYRVVLDPEASGTAAPPPVPVSTHVSETGRVLTILSGGQRRGTWRVPKKLRVLALWGDLELDFCEAEFGPGVTDVRVTSVMASISIILPPHLHVACTGAGILGVFEELERNAGEWGPGVPLLRITGSAILGNVETTTRRADTSGRAEAGAGVGHLGR